MLEVLAIHNKSTGIFQNVQIKKIVIFKGILAHNLTNTIQKTPTFIISSEPAIKYKEWEIICMHSTS